MPWVFTRRHRTLHACRYRIFAAYASAENPSATDGRQGAGKHGGIFPRWADHLRTTLTDESVLVRPTDAQKPEPCSPVRSATGADRTPSEHWHPAIWEHACMVSDAFPSLAPCIVAISSPGCSPSRPLAQPPSQFSLPPLLPFLLRHTNAMTTTRGSQTFFPSPTAWECSLRCLSICVAHQIPRSDMASWLSSQTSGWHDTT